MSILVHSVFFRLINHNILVLSLLSLTGTRVACIGARKGTCSQALGWVGAWGGTVTGVTAIAFPFNINSTNGNTTMEADVSF